MKPFNVKGKGRHYKSPTTNQNLPSVTNILKCYPKQEPLVRWAASIQITHDVQASYEFNHPGRQFEDAESYKAAFKEYIGTPQHRRKLKKAGNIGKEIHKAIEADMKAILGQEAEPQEELEGAVLWAYMAFQDWWSQCDITPLESELFVHDDELGYAGTTDLAAEVVITEALLKRVAPKHRSDELVSHIGSQVTAIIDFKSGKYVYDDMPLQLAAYIEAWEGSDLDTWGMILRLPKTEEDPEFEVRMLMPRHRQQKLETFLAVKKIWEDKHNAWY